MGGVVTALKNMSAGKRTRGSVLLGLRVGCYAVVREELVASVLQTAS